ncbi:hypothetical protein B0H19DRAFT_1265219 [Mycena capillaripes]|nr:hypothetical protein B0H19DRAFT_1265219 [Mycena capillaripes]
MRPPRANLFFSGTTGIRCTWCTARAFSPPSPAPSSPGSGRAEGEDAALDDVLVVMRPPRAIFFLAPLDAALRAYLPHRPPHPPPRYSSAWRTPPSLFVIATPPRPFPAPSPANSSPREGADVTIDILPRAFLLLRERPSSSLGRLWQHGA